MCRWCFCVDSALARDVRCAGGLGGVRCGRVREAGPRLCKRLGEPQRERCFATLGGAGGPAQRSCGLDCEPAVAAIAGKQTPSGSSEPAPFLAVKEVAPFWRPLRTVDASTSWLPETDRTKNQACCEREQPGQSNRRNRARRLRQTRRRRRRGCCWCRCYRWRLRSW